jgi:hypothetical protein
VAFAVVATFIATPKTASADETWCVGGFVFSGQTATREECKSKRGSPWHFHSFMLGPDGKCYSCWDAEDNTCSDVVANKSGYDEVGTARCKDNEVQRPWAGKIKWRPDPSVAQPGKGGKTPTLDPSQVDPPSAPPDPSSVGTPDASPIRISPTPTKPATPKKPTVKKINLKARMVKMSPGPYAINEPVEITWEVVGPDGKRRKTKAGVMSVIGPDGNPVTVKVKPNRDGTVTGTLTIPASGAVTFTYVPSGIILPVREEEGSVTPGTANLTAGACRLRGTVLAPKPGEILAADNELAGELRDSSGNPSTTLNGAVATFVVEMPDGTTKKVPATANGNTYQGSLSLDLPDDVDAANVVIRLVGEGATSDVCPGQAVTARITKLGLAMDVVTRDTCYVGRPCDVSMKFRMASDPTAREAGEQFVTDSALVVDLRLGNAKSGTLTPDKPGAVGATFTGSFTPRLDGDAELTVVATVGGADVTEMRTIRVREPIELELVESIDFGTLHAGMDWRETCVRLDFATSRGIEEQSFRFKATKPEGCDSEPVILAGGMGATLSSGDGSEAEFGYYDPEHPQSIPICIANIPRCASESPGEPVYLTVQALSPDFPDQTRDIQLVWKVEGRGFLACNWWWLAAIAGGAFVLLIGYGYVRPYNFSQHDTVKLANEKKKLSRAVKRRLRELPGGKSGFYRSAATGLREDGSATNKLRTAGVVLRARKNDVIIECPGGLSRISPKSRKMEQLTVGKEGHIASKTTVYNVGSLYFEIG